MRQSSFVAGLGAVVLALVHHAADAASYSFQYEMPTAGSTATLLSGDYGATLNEGDTVSYHLQAATGYAWYAPDSVRFWTPVGVQPGDERFGNYQYTFAWNGTQVAAANTTNEYSAAIHVGGTGVWLPSFSGYFDEFAWTGIITDMSGPGEFKNFGFGIYTNAVYGREPGFASVSAVPLPASAWLFGSAVLGLFGWRRRGTAAA